MPLRKSARADLRSKYTLHVEIGFTLALGLVILAFKVNTGERETFEIVSPEQEIVQMDEIRQTRQDLKPPPPPRPPVPVEVPNDLVLDDTALDLDATLDINEAPSELPPPPITPPAVPEEVPDEAEAEVFVVVENMPELIGGQKALYGLLKYPDMARRAAVEGLVVVQFIVDEEGNVTDPIILKSIGAGCDEEAIRVLQAMKFKPGKQRGKPVRVRMSQPIRFVLN